MNCENPKDEWVSKDAALRKLCDDGEYRLRFVPPPFWTAELYGFGLQISRYGYYPYFLPLCVYTDHGPGYYDEIPIHEIESHSSVQLCHSPDSVKLWGKVRRKKAYCLYSPFVFYRKKADIDVAAEPRGTVAFPAHSTPSIDDAGGFARYIEDLKRLPRKYHPIKVCLHMHDIKKGLHVEFLEQGFDVVTAGNTSDQRFIARFYEIVAAHKYATSNVPGSYLYYCVEMGVPFFVHGEKPRWINKTDRNLAVGSYDPFAAGYGKVVYDLFYTENPELDLPKISGRQKEFVERHLGLRGGISRLKMALVLYGAFARFLFSARGAAYVCKNNILARGCGRLLSAIGRRLAKSR